MRKRLRHRSPITNIKNTWSILKYTLPSIIMLIFTALYWMADWLLSSIFIWVDALSSINIVYPFICMIVAVWVMIWTWWSAIISEKLWEGKANEARNSFSQIIVSTIILWVIISIFAYIFSWDIVKLLWANETFYDNSFKYFRIIALFTVSNLLQQVFQMLFITAWKPKTWLLITVFWWITNIILWYIFLAHFNMWVAWAWLSSWIAWSLVSIFWIVYFHEKNTELYLTKFKLKLKEICEVFENGSSEMITDVSVSIITFLFNILMLKYLWESWVAAATIILYIQLFIYSIYMWFSNWIAPVESYFYWEQDFKTLRTVLKINLRIIITTSIVLTIACYLWGPYIINLLDQWDKNVSNIAIQWGYWFYLCFLFAWLNIYTSSFFTSVSNERASAIVSFLRSIVITILCIIILPLLFWINAIWLAVSLAEWISFLISIRFLHKYWKKY